MALPGFDFEEAVRNERPVEFMACIASLGFDPTGEFQLKPRPKLEPMPEAPRVPEVIVTENGQQLDLRVELLLPRQRKAIPLPHQPRLQITLLANPQQRGERSTCHSTSTT